MNTETKMSRELLVCDCFSAEHNVQIVIDEEHKELTLEVYLHQYRSLWERIKVAVKYIFGYKCQYGHWDCFNFRKEDLVKIKNVLEKL